MTAKYAACCLAMAAAANAIVGPNLPWGGVTDIAGQDCNIGWSLDTTGTWNNMSIELMTGDNQNFIHLSWVARGLDGTSGDGTYSWTCPVVDPPAPIYFYQFTNPGQSATYTTRFTLAAADGSSIPAPQQSQPDGSAIPWGTGRIVSGGDGTASSGSGSGSSSGAVSRGSTSAGINSASSAAGTSSAPSPSGGGAVVSSSASSSAPLDADTTVITVQPSTTAMGRMSSTSARTSSSSMSSGIAANSNNSTGSASRNANQGSMAAGLGLLLAMAAGYLLA